MKSIKSHLVAAAVLVGAGLLTAGTGFVLGRASVATVAVAAPAGATGGVLDVTFAAGGSTAQLVDIEIIDSGNTQIIATNNFGGCNGDPIEVYVPPVLIQDDFEDGVLNDRLKTVVSNFQRAWVEFESPVGAAGAPATAATFHVYVGPLSRNVFAQDRYATLAPAITYSMAPDWLARLLLSIFDLFRSLTGARASPSS